jgi:effector-binding domain-containing protein
MTGTCEIVEVAPRTLACRRKRVRWSEIGTSIHAGLDAVYAFLKSAPVKQQGQNVCVYREPDAEGIELDAGVEVSGPFEPVGSIICAATPGGRAAHVVHLGEYAALRAAYDAIETWCQQSGIARTGICWEMYGDWHDDPAQRRTDVFCQVL